MRRTRDSMENHIDEKTKSVASIPANYVSILQLQERWLKEKERKRKEKYFVERGVKKQHQVDDEPRNREEGDLVKLEEKGFRMHCDVNRWKKEPNCVEKEELEVSAIVSNKDKYGANSREKKKIWSKNQGGSVKEEIKRVCKSKGENAASDSIAVEAQFQDLSIKTRVKDVKESARLNNGQGHDWSSTRDFRAKGTMVWVKKGKNDGAAGGYSV